MVDVANTTELISALDAKVPTGGGEIVLTGSTYSNWGTRTYAFNSTVTIRGSDPNNKAVIDGGMGWLNSQNVTVKDIFADKGIATPSSTGTAFLFDGGSNLQLLDSNLRGGFTGGQFVNASNVTVSNVFCNEIRSDFFKFAGLSTASFTRLQSGGTQFPLVTGPLELQDHPDFMQFQGTSSNIDIWGCTHLPQNYGNAQGIFFDNGDYSDVTVEQCFIHTQTGIGIGHALGGRDSGTNIVYTNNTGILLVPSTVINGLSILVPPGTGNVSTNNVYVLFEGAEGIQPGNNHRIQRTNDAIPFHYSDYFTNALAGLGADAVDFTPVPGSPAVNEVGAYLRMDELINGIPEGLTLSQVTIDNASMGTVSVVSNQLEYTPDAGFGGDVAKGSYTMTDGVTVDTARWSVPVTLLSTLKANDDTFPAIVQGSGPVLLDVLANDSE